jgi:two-component system LytT family response regulator
MAFKTLLVDDEPLAIKRLERLLEPYKDLIQLVGKAYDGLDALELIERLQPDLVFLDIQMPGLTGLELLDQLDRLPWIVFCTAYDSYALEAFETYAIDYLLKPVSPQRLLKAVDKLKRLTPTDLTDLQTQLHSLAASLSPPPFKRLQVRLGDRIRFLEIAEVFFFRASEKYVEACCYEASYLLSQSLNQLQDDLPPDDFVRIHRSALVNLKHVAEITRDHNGTALVRMKNKAQTELPLSRTAKSRLGF